MEEGFNINFVNTIYGFDQKLDNSFSTRIGHSTSIKNLYLLDAWTKPGHGYGSVL